MENIHTAINGLNSIFELERNVFKLFNQYRDEYQIPFRARFEAKKTLVRRGGLSERKVCFDVEIANCHKVSHSPCDEFMSGDW